MSKIIRVETVHAQDLKTLFDVLKEVLNEFKMDFIRDDNNDTTNITDSDDNSNSDSDSNEKSSSNSDSEPESEKDKKKQKIVVKKNISKNTSKSLIEDSEKEQEKTKTNKNKDKAIANDNSNSISTSTSASAKSELKKSAKKPSTGGIRIIELDEHQTLLIYIKLNASSFYDFYVKYPVYSIGLDLLTFHKFLKTIDKESVLTMHIDKNDEQNIVYNVKNVDKPNSATFTQKLMDLDTGKQSIPSQSDFELLVTMETNDFHKLCREMNQFSDYVEITCTSKEITFKCQGDSTTYMKKFSNSDKSVQILVPNDKGSKKPVIVQAIYELRYIVYFGKCVNLCSEIQLYLKNDYPLFIHYTIAVLGRMLIGLTPVDEKAIKKDNDYDDKNDKFYDEGKKVVLLR